MYQLSIYIKTQKGRRRFALPVSRQKNALAQPKTVSLFPLFSYLWWPISVFLYKVKIHHVSKNCYSTQNLREYSFSHTQTHTQIITKNRHCYFLIFGFFGLRHLVTTDHIGFDLGVLLVPEDFLENHQLQDKINGFESRLYHVSFYV